MSQQVSAAALRERPPEQGVVHSIVAHNCGEQAEVRVCKIVSHQKAAAAEALLNLCEAPLQVSLCIIVRCLLGSEARPALAALRTDAAYHCISRAQQQGHSPCMGRLSRRLKQFPVPKGTGSIAPQSGAKSTTMDYAATAVPEAPPHPCWWKTKSNMSLFRYSI